MNNISSRFLEYLKNYEEKTRQGRFLIKTTSCYPNEKSRNIVIKFIESQGLKIKQVSFEKMMKIGCEYDGETLYHNKEEHPTLLHEFSHWLCCTNTRRNKREYGLGSFQLHDDRNKLLISRKNANLEEYHTCILSQIYEIYLNLGIHCLFDTTFLTTINGKIMWCQGKYIERDVEKSLKFLIKNNLITEDFQPTFRKRS